MVGLADELGEIYRLRFPDRTVVIVSTYALVDETCDEKRFQITFKMESMMGFSQYDMRELILQAVNVDNWEIAQRVLMPAFGPLSIRGIFDELHDIASHLALEWARYGLDEPIMLLLARAAPVHRGHGDFLTEADEKSRRLPLPAAFYAAALKFQDDIAMLRDTAPHVLESRKADKSDCNNLLDAMLRGVDSKTGWKMTDGSIMDNIITFLIAGHETTSGLLSFCLLSTDHLPKNVPVLHETLRLNATIPLFTVEAVEDTLLAGKCTVKAGVTIINLLAKSHLDPRSMATTRATSNPSECPMDYLTRARKSSRTHGSRLATACEPASAALFLAGGALGHGHVLQNFDFSLDPGCHLEYKQTITITPKDLYMKAKLRHDLTPTTLERRLA
ncbi:cytochrome P450 [Aspergillus similis]